MVSSAPLSWVSLQQNPVPQSSLDVIPQITEILSFFSSTLDLSISILGTETDLVAWECYEKMAVSAQSAFRAGDLDQQAPIPNFQQHFKLLKQLSHD
jgi:hypothetical protein